MRTSGFPDFLPVKIPVKDKAYKNPKQHENTCIESIKEVLRGRFPLRSLSRVGNNAGNCALYSITIAWQ
jgi:hypothetical protein